MDTESNKSSLPFSQRNMDISKKISITQNVRHRLAMLIKEVDYENKLQKKILKKLERYYEVKCYNENGLYVTTNDLYKFIYSTKPEYVLDAVEIFSQLIYDLHFDSEVNDIFRRDKMDFCLDKSLIILKDKFIEKDMNCFELGIDELLQSSKNYFDKDIKIAVEKLWDSFERIKSFYNEKNKQNSVELLLEHMCGGNEHIKENIETECLALTRMGNDFRIRHHEMRTKDIKEQRHYEYFFNRCLSFVKLALISINE